MGSTVAEALLLSELLWWGRGDSAALLLPPLSGTFSMVEGCSAALLGLLELNDERLL